MVGRIRARREPRPAAALADAHAARRPRRTVYSASFRLPNILPTAQQLNVGEEPPGALAQANDGAAGLMQLVLEHARVLCTKEGSYATSAERVFTSSAPAVASARHCIACYMGLFHAHVRLAVEQVRAN